jgi:hypothetical protein
MKTNIVYAVFIATIIFASCSKEEESCDLMTKSSQSCTNGDCTYKITFESGLEVLGESNYNYYDEKFNEDGKICWDGEK